MGEIKYCNLDFDHLTSLFPCLHVLHTGHLGSLNCYCVALWVVHLCCKAVSALRLQRELVHHSPRLFECSNQTGQFRMTEVDDFDQSDLDEEDVMLLDTWEEVRGRSSAPPAHDKEKINFTD